MRGTRSGLGWAGLAVLAACGGNPKPEIPPAPPPTSPLPTAGIAGQQVSVLPLTMVAADEALGWDSVLTSRRATLNRADSIIGELLTARSPEVNWVLPPELRREARRSPSVALNPDQMGTAFLRNEGVVDIADPLRSELRTMVALSGGRFVLAPAALVYRPAVTTAAGPPKGKAAAELTMVLVDGRLGKVGWRTVARGEGDDPWAALTRAVKALTPGLP